MQGDDTAAVIEVSPYRISDYCPRTLFIRTQTGDRVISSPVPPDSCSRALAGGALSAAKGPGGCQGWRVTSPAPGKFQAWEPCGIAWGIHLAGAEMKGNRWIHVWRGELL